MAIESSSSLTELLERLAGSPDDEDAWTGLYERLWPYVFAINYRLVRARHDVAEDLSQEVFLRLRRYCPFARLQNAEELKAYVAAMCRNVVRSSLKTAHHREVPLEEVPPEALVSPDVGVARRVEADDLVRELSAQLGPEDRRLLRLILEDHGIKEIARRSGLSYSAAGVRAFRLRRKLAAILRREAPL
jgi:RNA polymerase sigma factor (sigma-70 family)